MTMAKGGLPARTDLASWGRLPQATQRAVGLSFGDGALPLPAEGSVLPRGLGRSYGDSGLNDGGTVLLAEGLDRFVAFDPQSGLLRCEAGVSLDAILRLMVPRGWFLPVTPGTRFVTVGGAVANDVHGKNHHMAGTIGRWVKAFELLRSDGSRRLCTPDENADWFGATIGGLGLTGLITWVDLQLIPINNPYIATESTRFGGLDGFFEENHRAESGFDYTVAWVDCLASGRSLGRGLYMAGNHAPRFDGDDKPVRLALKAAVPVDFPGWVLGRWSVKLFNALYYRRQLRRVVRAHQPFVPFFYPLDAVGQWNRIYGRRGFYQYQCVVPPEVSPEVMRRLLGEIAASGQASFLAVLKTFGTLPSPGWLSFPRPGATLALDFPNNGDATTRLFDRLDAIVDEAGGAIYPAKDARLSGERFRRQYPTWERFAGYVDPRFSSSFWRRVTGDAPVFAVSGPKSA